jgi:hypothetical protein
MHHRERVNVTLRASVKPDLLIQMRKTPFTVQPAGNVHHVTVGATRPQDLALIFERAEEPLTGYPDRVDTVKWQVALDSSGTV